MTDTPIRKIYLLSHTHTDFGYTDHVDAVWLHHRDIHDRMLDVLEESFDAPEGSQHRWTCELTSTTLDYLRHASDRNVERFQTLHKAGRIAVGGLRYHWTPLASPHLAIETLRDIDTLRSDFGIDVRSAMQCDVNGLAWFWNDLLVERGVSFLSTHQNPHRGYWGARLPSLWHWKNRSGGSMLVHQGEHYGHGGTHMHLGLVGKQDKTLLTEMLARHAASEAWAADVSVLTITSSANGDNTYPQTELSAAVQDWNAREEVPMEIVTLDQLGDVLGAVPDLPEQSGEWMDSWCDGVASTPLETAAARAAERLLPVLKELQPGDEAAYREAVNALALYDEHTWGAHSSATAPANIFATIQRTAKSNHAYRAFALSLRAMAKGSRAMAAKDHAPVEGDPWLDALSHPDLGADEQGYLVVNPSDEAMEVDWPVPFDRGAGTQISIPQAYGVDDFFLGFGDDGWSDALQSSAPSGNLRLKASLPPRGQTVLHPTRPDTSDCAAGPGWIENATTRIELDPETGALTRWVDRTSGQEVIGDSGALLGPQMTRIIEGWGQRDIFQAPYWERSEKPMGWAPEDLMAPVEPRVEVGEGRVGPAGAEIDVVVRFDGAEITTRISLKPGSADVRVEALQRVQATRRGFSLDWVVRPGGAHQRLLVDTGGGLVDATAGHIASSCLGWQSLQKGLVFERADQSGIAIAALDTPLFQPGGPSWRRPHDAPQSDAYGSFWTINTHWDTNFPITVNDQAPARFVLRFLTEEAAARGEAALTQMTTLPVIVRVPNA